MAGFDNEVVYADNVDFSGGSPVSGKITTDGQILIGSTATPNIRVGTLTSSDGSLTFTSGPGSINASVSGGSTTIKTITGSDGSAQVPLAGNFNILGSGSITSVGTANTETIQLTGLTNHAVLIGAGTATITKVGPVSSTGAVLQSNGAGSDPGFSTATYPSIAGTSGTILRSDGTNIVNSTATYPGTAGSAGTLLGSNATNIINTTATYPFTTTINRILYSSANNTIGEIPTGNNQMLITGATGVPSISSTLAGSFSFSISTAGSTESLTVANTDNSNASSTAVGIISTGGTSAGDAYNRYVVGTTRSYAVGIDNSDTQSFKINTTNSGSVGPSTGSNVMRIDNSGNVSKPLNSCVTADLNTGLTNATGDGTFINPVIFDTDSSNFFDQNGNYDTTTGIFTAPATGKYLVTARVTFNGIGVAHTSGIVRINLNGGAYMISDFNPALSANASGEYTAQISGILPIAATGTCAILAQVSGSTKTVGVKGNTSGSFTSLSVVLVS